MKSTRIRLKPSIGCFFPFVFIPMLSFFYIIFPLITRPLHLYNPIQQTILFYVLVVGSTIFLFWFLMFDISGKPEYFEVGQDYLILPDGERIDRQHVQHIFFEDGDLILMDGKRMTHTLRTVGSRKKLRELFRNYRYHVGDQDPYIAEYQEFYRDHPDLSVVENGMFIKMIQLESDEHEAEADKIRHKLRSEHGVYVDKDISRKLFRRIHL